MLIVELAGRDRELSAVGRALDDVRGGASRALAVLGEAGIGKSALLGAMAESARGRGLRVLERRAAEHEQYVPCSVVDAALVEQLGGRSCCCSTTCTGPIRPRSTWCGSCCTARRRFPTCWSSPARRRANRALPLLDLARRLPAYEELALEPLDRAASLTLLADVPVAERERIVEDSRGIPL